MLSLEQEAARSNESPRQPPNLSADQDWVDWLQQELYSPVPARPLALFRLAFGLLSAVSMAHTLVCTDEIEAKFGWAELNFRYEIEGSVLPRPPAAAASALGWAAVVAATDAKLIE